MPILTKSALETPIDSYIVVFDNMLSSDFCDDLVAEFEFSDEWNAALVGEGASVERNVRNADVINLSSRAVLQKNQVVRKKIEDTLYSACRSAVGLYQAQFAHCRIVQGMAFELLRYRQGGYYRMHTDSFNRVPRSLSCSFALNDDFEGGALGFFGGEKTLTPDKGAAVLFPSNFLFPHEILPVTQGTRYSVVTWMI